MTVTATVTVKRTIHLTVLALLVLGAVASPAAADDEHRALRRLAALESAEPTVAEVRRAALRFAGLEGDVARGWARRARWSGLVPRVSLRASRGIAWDEDWSSTADREISGLDNDVAYEVRAVFELDRLAFDPAELRAASAGQQLHRARLEIGREVTALWYRRRARQIAAIWHPAASVEEDLARELEIDELTAQLDALTDGFLSGELRR